MKLITPSNIWRQWNEVEHTDRAEEWNWGNNDWHSTITIVNTWQSNLVRTNWEHMIWFLNYKIDWSIKYWTKTDILFLVCMLMITLSAKCFRYYRDNIMTYIKVNQIYDLSIFFILNSFNYFIFCFQNLPKT